MTLDTLPLELVAQIAVGPRDAWLGRMSLIDVDPADPDNETRDWFWRRTATVEAHRRAELAAARAGGVEEGRRAGSPAAVHARTRPGPVAP